MSSMDIFTETIEGKGIMAILDASGDTKVIWDKDNEDEVETAKDTFDRLTKKGFVAFSVKKNGDADKKIKEFDPDLEKIILIPQMAGG